MFVRRFVFEWSNLQQDYIVLQTIVSEKHSGTSWITGLIQIIWNHVYHNWEARNADLHGVDAATRESAQYVQAQRETEEIYWQCSLVQPRDWDVFYSNTNEHFQEEPTDHGLRQWLNTWKLLLLRSIQDSTATGTHCIHSIRDFCSPLPAARFRPIELDSCPCPLSIGRPSVGSAISNAAAFEIDCPLFCFAEYMDDTIPTRNGRELGEIWVSKVGTNF